MATKQTVEQMGGAFLDALRLSPEFQLERRRYVGSLFAQASWLLPEPDGWTTIEDPEHGQLLVLSGDLLLVISIETNPERDMRLSMKAHPARVTEVTYQREDRHTAWRFQFRDRAPLELTGTHEYHYDPTTPPPFDRTEGFARTLARKAGWRIEGSNAV